MRVRACMRVGACLWILCQCVYAVGLRASDRTTEDSMHTPLQKGAQEIAAKQAPLVRQPVQRPGFATPPHNVAPPC